MEDMEFFTWQGNLLLILFFVTGCWSVCFFLFAVLTSVKACMGNYSIAAVVLYWLCVGTSFLLIGSGNNLLGIEVFVWSSPVLTLLMYLIERDRKRTLNNHKNENNN